MSGGICRTKIVREQSNVDRATHEAWGDLAWIAQARNNKWMQEKSVSVGKYYDVGMFLQVMSTVTLLSILSAETMGTTTRTFCPRYSCCTSFVTDTPDQLKRAMLRTDARMLMANGVEFCICWKAAVRFS